MFYQEVITKVSNVKLYILMYPFRSVVALYWYKFRIGTVLNLLQTEFHSDFVSFFRMQFWLLRSVYNSGQKWNETA